MNGRKMFAPGDLKLDDKGHIRAAFAQLNVIDSDGDVTLPGAFPSKSVPMSAYGHTSWDGALPVGRGAITEEGDWAVFEGDFFLNTTHGQDAYLTVKGLGELAEYSYGYNVIDSERGTFNGTPANFLKSIDPWEVSPVLKGAGVGTHTIAIKSGAPGTDAPYAEAASWYLEHVPALIERTKDREAHRATEGRSLSKADRERLEDIASSFLAHADAIWALLAEPESEKSDDRAARALLVEIERARLAGIPI